MRHCWPIIALCAAAPLTAIASSAAPAPHALEHGALEASAQQPAASDAPTILTVGGTATVSKAPDQATLTLGVMAKGKTSVEAQDALNTQMDRVLKAIRNSGIPGLVIQTQGLSLYPEYDQRPVREGREREPEIIGYRASNTVSITCPEVGKSGALIDAAVAAGSNQIAGISFSLKDDSAAKREAIQGAAMDAKAKAEALADALGLRIVRIAGATTEGAAVRPVHRAFGAEMSARTAMAPASVEPGETKVSAGVTVEFVAQPR